MSEQQKIKGGKLLLAEPFELDPYFKRAAILLCQHKKRGSHGFIINKQLDINLEDLLPDFEVQFPVFYGGPVEENTLHFLHSAGDILDDSEYVSNGIYEGGDFEKLKSLINNQLISPNQIRFFIGYSGWSEGQLKEEFENGSWVMADMDPNYLYKTEPQHVWKLAYENKGISYGIIGSIPEGNLVN